MRSFSAAYHAFHRKALSSQAGMWVVLGVLIGIAAGVGSLILYNLINLIGYSC